MKKLTVTLAVLMLFLQVFSGIPAFGAEGDNIKIEGYTTLSQIFQGDRVLLSISITNKSNEALENMYVDIDQSSDFYGDPAYTNFYHLASLAGNAEKVTLSSGNRLVYKGTGNTLKLIFKYRIGSTDYTETQTLYIREAVPTDNTPPSQDPSELAPKLVTDNTGNMPTVIAGKTYKLKYTVKNASNYQAKNVNVALKMADASKAPLVLQNYNLRQTITTIGGGTSADAEFSITVNDTAPEGIYALDLKYDYENTSGKSFTSQDTVYIKVVNNNTSPKITVDGISVKQSKSSSEAVVLELKLKNLGTLKAEDIKVTLGGLKSGGFTAYNTTDVRYVDAISGKGTATVSYELLPPASGAAGANELTVKFDYKDAAGNSYSDQNQIFVPAGEGDGSARPSLEFEGISTPKEVLGSGSEFEIGFSLKNNGGAAAKNIKVSLSPEAGILPKSMNTVYFAEIGANKSEKVTFKMFTSGEAATKNYSIALNVEYEDAYGNKFNALQYTGVFVENNNDKESGKTTPRIIIDNYSIDPFPVNAGEEINVKMSFLNTSKTIDVSNIKVSVTSADGTFTPTDSGNTFYIEEIPRTGRVERELKMSVKPDAEQKSYVLDVNFEYEDEKGNAYTAKETMSVRVLQSPRLVTGQISMMTETFVGQPVSLYLDFYNMGKSTLYNLMVSIEGDFQGQGLNYYVGNFEPGRTDYFDVSFTPMNPGMQKGNVLFSFEDANGKTTEIRKEFEINVMEMGMPDPMVDEWGNPIDMGGGMPDMGMPGETGKLSIWVYIGIGAGVLVAAVAVFIILRKRHIKRKELSLDE